LPSLQDGVVALVGQVKFGLGRMQLWQRLTGCAGPVTRPGLMPVRPELVAEVRFFGRYLTGSARDGVQLAFR
jgi:hypothetical protein